MARGWESKSVEEQQSEFNKPGAAGKERLSEEARRRAAALQSLQLQRAHVAQEIEQSQNPRFRELKRQELVYLDSELSRLRTSRA
jgi:hypothetical protein